MFVKIDFVLAIVIDFAIHIFYLKPLNFKLLILKFTVVFSTPLSLAPAREKRKTKLNECFNTHIISSLRCLPCYTSERGRYVFKKMHPKNNNFVVNIFM